MRSCVGGSGMRTGRVPRLAWPACPRPLPHSRHPSARPRPVAALGGVLLLCPHRADLASAASEVPLTRWGSPQLELCSLCRHRGPSRSSPHPPVFQHCSQQVSDASLAGEPPRGAHHGPERAEAVV